MKWSEIEDSSCVSVAPRRSYLLSANVSAGSHASAISMRTAFLQVDSTMVVVGEDCRSWRRFFVAKDSVQYSEISGRTRMRRRKPKGRKNEKSTNMRLSRIVTPSFWILSLDTCRYFYRDTAVASDVIHVISANEHGESALFAEHQKLEQQVKDPKT